MQSPGPHGLGGELQHSKNEIYPLSNSSQD